MKITATVPGRKSNIFVLLDKIPYLLCHVADQDLPPPPPS